MKYFVFSDVHGFYDLLIGKLNSEGFDINNPNHMLISLGDNFDRGPQNYLVYSFLKQMKDKNKIILLRGNHEDLLLNMINTNTANYYDITNGTYQTINEFSIRYFGKFGDDLFFNGFELLYQELKNDGVLDLIYDMKDYYETDNYVFTHGFIPVLKDDEYNPIYDEDWRKSDRKKFKEARWTNGISMSINYNIGVPNKKIVIGHWHTSYGHVRKNNNKENLKSYKELEFSSDANFNIYTDKNIIAIDACTAHTNKINVLVVEDNYEE